MLSLSNYSVFEQNADCIVNTVNCDGFMGKGLALEFASRYPKLEILYKEDCKNKLVQLNRLNLYNVDGQNILNFPTKLHYKMPSQIEWIEGGLHFFRNNYESLNIKSIAFPLLGASNGGLDPTTVLRLMEKTLSDLKIDVIVCNNKEAGPKEMEMISKFNSCDIHNVSKEIKLNIKQAESLKNFQKKIKRFYDLQKLESIGKETYKKLYSYFNKYSDNEPQQMSLFEF